MNKVFLLGRIGGDPEVKELTGTKVAKFSLATSETYKKNEEKIIDTTWHNLVFWGKQCDTLKSYVHKGDQLLVEGKIQKREYTDKEGVRHWADEIVCDRFELLGSNTRSTGQKTESNEAKTRNEKVSMKPLSNINDLPGNVANYDEIPDDDKLF